MKHIIIIIFCLFTFAFSLQAQQEVLNWFARGSGVTSCDAVDTFHVNVGSYLPLSHTTNLTLMEVIVIGQQYRIRQNGTLYGITFYCAATVSVTSLQFRVWRKDGSTYDRIGTSENFIASCTAGQEITVYFTQPIANCREGDYYSLVYAPNTSPLQGVADANCTSKYISATGSDSLNYAWDSQTNLAYGIPVTMYMLNPNIVFIGDSQIGNSTSLLQTSLASTFSASLPYKVGALLNYTYQNMGVGGNSSTQVLARFSADMIDLHPTLGIVLVNVNDIAAGTSSNTIVSNNQTMIENMAGNNIRPYFIENLPWSNGTIAQLRQFDSVRSRVRTIVEANGGYVISTVSTFGVNNDTGDVGNLWKLNPTYSDDGVHLNEAGNTVLAALVSSSIQSNGCPSYDIDVTIPVVSTGLRYYWTDENAVGTLASWQNLVDTTKFRQGTSANRPVKTTAVKLDSTDNMTANITTITTTSTLEFIIKVTDTNSYAKQMLLAIRGSSPTLTVLGCQIGTEAITGTAKLGVGYYNGTGGYTDKNYSTTSIYNKYAMITITTDSINKTSVYYNGELQTSLGSALQTTYNQTGTLWLGANTTVSTGLQNASIRMISYWSVKSSLSEIQARYTIYNSLGLIDP